MSNCIACEVDGMGQWVNSQRRVCVVVSEKLTGDAENGQFFQGRKAAYRDVDARNH